MRLNIKSNIFLLSYQSSELFSSKNRSVNVIKKNKKWD